MLSFRPLPESQDMLIIILDWYFHHTHLLNWKPSRSLKWWLLLLWKSIWKVFHELKHVKLFDRTKEYYSTYRSGAFCLVKFGLQVLKDGLISHFCLPVRLQVPYWCASLFNMEAQAEFLESFIVKLLSIIEDNIIGQTKW